MDDKSANLSAGYYAVIPADVRYDAELSSSAKLLYAEITSLCRQEGYCWAANDYFAGLFGVTDSTISRWVSALEKHGYITTEMVPTETGSERRIYGGIFAVERQDGGVYAKSARPPGGCTQKAQDPPGGVRKNAEGGLRKKRKQNNITVNNIPPISPKCAPDRFEGLWNYYPKKGRKNKQRAIKAWDKLHPDADLIDRIAVTVKKLKASREWKDGIGIPYLSTFLNNLGDYLDNAENLDEDNAPQDPPAVEGRDLPVWT